MLARLHEIWLELTECTIYGNVNTKNWMHLYVRGHGMDSDDKKATAAIVFRLNANYCPARHPSRCNECDSTNRDCLLVACGNSLQDRLGKIMEAAAETSHSIGKRVQISVLHAEKSYVFSAEWRYMGGSLGASGYYFLDNTWTYFASNSTEQLLASLRDVPGIARVETEEIKDHDVTAIDIVVALDRGTSLAKCLIAATRVIAE